MNNPFSAEYINSFLDAASNIFEHLLKTSMTRGNMAVKTQLEADNDDIEIRIGVVGDVEGVIAYCLSKKTALKFIECLVPGMSEADAMEQSSDILGEIGNMISGNSITNLSKFIKNIDLLPPQVYFKEQAQKPEPILHTTLAFDFNSILGSIQANICLYIKSNQVAI